MNLDKEFEIILNGRQNFIKLVSGLGIDQLNCIPDKFKNNIAWNFGHIVVSQHLLCYRLSGLPLKLDENLINRYKKDSAPENFIDEKEIEFLKNSAVDLIHQTQSDYNSGAFKNFQSYTTAFGVKMDSISDAIKFVGVHDGLHLGYSMSLRKLVQ